MGRALQLCEDDEEMCLEGMYKFWLMQMSSALKDVVTNGDSTYRDIKEFYDTWYNGEPLGEITDLKVDNTIPEDVCKVFKIEPGLEHQRYPSILNGPKGKGKGNTTAIPLTAI